MKKFIPEEYLDKVLNITSQIENSSNAREYLNTKIRKLSKEIKDMMGKERNVDNLIKVVKDHVEQEKKAGISEEDEAHEIFLCTKILGRTPITPLMIVIAEYMFGKKINNKYELVYFMEELKESMGKDKFIEFKALFISMYDVNVVKKIREVLKDKE